ncbi:MBL fold metallo-hydrolase [Salinarimonas ramus]|uniref:MBL fold metallo-hydrolase n=1 Tax=Salinarimonas ramus TaxID=690164 RepID=A0A917QE16_9HYPH|nr:MBL fold metallo-hydrolase [Salinarimonas ramus]GGK44549.1 MBL fold metallo-hydrolase [Salinarimonas ramus]
MSRRDASPEPAAGGVTRRRILAVAPLAGAALALGAPPSIRLARARASETLSIGDIRVRVVSDGTVALPVSFTLPQTGAADLDALFRENGEEPPREFVNQTNVVLIESGDRRILVDTGSGPTFQATAGRLTDALLEIDVAPEDVTDVVFTHGHADHLWGAVDDFEEGPRFPNARHVMGATEHAYWTDPATPETAPDWLKGLALGAARVIGTLGDVLETAGEDEEIAPGLRYVPTPGHTPGHMSVLVSSGADQLMIGGDALTNALVSFQKPDWPLGTDLDRELAIATRLSLLDRLATDRIGLVGFHLPFPGFGFAERRNDAFIWVSG